MHGGGFYQVQKYVVAPPVLPEHLAWFKWEAYTTWLSGFALMVVLYYLEASSALVEAGRRPRAVARRRASRSACSSSPGSSTTSSTGSSRTARVLWPVLFVLVALVGLGLGELFSPRAAWLQVGAMIGTVMAANVFFDIIPAHRELIRAKQAGREPDPRPGIQAKQRSVHNNYLTLPVLLTMLAGHFPFAYGADHAWLVLVGADGDRRLGAPLLQPPPRRQDALVDAGRRRRWRSSPSRSPSIGATSRPRRRRTQPRSRAVRNVFVTAGCGACHTLADAGATGAVGPSLDASSPSAALVDPASDERTGRDARLRRDALEPRRSLAVAAYVSSVARG